MNVIVSGMAFKRVQFSAEFQSGFPSWKYDHSRNFSMTQPSDLGGNLEESLYYTNALKEKCQDILNPSDRSPRHPRRSKCLRICYTDFES